ncbi:hypothetical protein PILCRDRAFT_15165 [Piloderma croceum F 1598]|uniref:Uncharacterized protein n=1 Tax=Piloderma croceum (strain F 1598) TaxID=765440 RepID=A0A0C3ELP6_PILCF|nr:hypothetical protein PILCRDRAFT_15165 [Piloderma croceum F 1598]
MACFSLELATEMCKFHESEADRALAFRDLIWGRLKIKLDAAKVAGTTFHTDGHTSVGSHAYVNTECKNEIDNMLNTLTHFFSAFKNAASSLKTYYTEVATQTPTAFATDEEA